MTQPFVIALHGGAGVEIGRDYTLAIKHLKDLAQRAKSWLEDGRSALDTVEDAVAEMEVSGLYVAGRGSAPSSSGDVELDASIMDGDLRRGGAVSAVRDVINPIRAARRVMEDTHHVLLSGNGALAFSLEAGLATVEDPSNYYVLPAGVEQDDIIKAVSGTRIHGTVGAVALDSLGRLAAATSTGGVFGKMAGRVGDTPLIGSGTWADKSVAISCTGSGEQFILAGGAQDIASRMLYAGASLQYAVDALIEDVGRLGGDGGVIAISRTGLIAFGCNSHGMKRAAAGSHIEAFASL